MYCITFKSVATSKLNVATFQGRNHKHRVIGVTDTVSFTSRTSRS